VRPAFDKCSSDQIRLATIELLPQLPIRPAEFEAGPSTRPIAAAANQGASVFAKANIDHAMSKTLAKRRTPGSSFWR
jgi:hypothetical protein